MGRKFKSNVKSDGKEKSTSPEGKKTCGTKGQGQEDSAADV